MCYHSGFKKNFLEGEENSKYWGSGGYLSISEKALSTFHVGRPGILTSLGPPVPSFATWYFKL